MNVDPDHPILQALLSPFAALILIWLVAAAAMALRPNPPRGALRLIGAGLGLAMLTALAPLALARPFLTAGDIGFSSHWLFGAGLGLALVGAGWLIRPIKDRPTR